MATAASGTAPLRKKPFRCQQSLQYCLPSQPLLLCLTWILPAGRYDYMTADTGQFIAAAESLDYDGGERLLPIPRIIH